MRILLLVCVLGLVSGAAGCRTSTEGGKGGPPMNITVKLAPNQETPIKDTKLILTLKEIVAGPPSTASIDAKLDTMEVLKTVKIGEYFELGEYKVTLATVDAVGKACEVQVVRQ